MPIRVVVAEDNYLVREGVVRLLGIEPDLEVVAAYEDFDALIAGVDADPPDVVITDIRMPPTGTDEGVRAANLIRESHPAVGVVVLSQYVEPDYALALLEHGSDGRAYLLKERVSDVDVLRRAIEAVATGGSVIDPRVVEALVAARARPQSPLDFLTPRESEVLAEMALGRNNAGHRRRARPVGAGGREAHQLAVREARRDVGARRAPPGEGGPPAPLGTP